MTTYLQGPSLAASTSTRLDSAAKHIQQCRVSQDHMQTLVTFDDQCDADELVRNKYRYCVHKDELVVGIAKNWANSKRFANSAYPRVISNLGRLADYDPTKKEYNEAIKMYIYVYHNAINIDSRDALIKAFSDGSKEKIDEVIKQDPSNPTGYFIVDPQKSDYYLAKRYMDCMFDFVPVGYANTLGWAHAHSGDTMTSVHIGGLRTVQNGHFEVFCGDVLQWYWPFERACFDDHGKRSPLTTLSSQINSDTNVPDFINKDPSTMKWSNTKDAMERKDFFDRQYGQKKGVEKHVAMIKPYKRDDEHPRIYDWYRVFAVAISSARPFEALDIRISRQAL